MVGLAKLESLNTLTISLRHHASLPGACSCLVMHARGKNLITCSLPNSSVKGCEKNWHSKITCQTFASCKTITPQKLRLNWEWKS